MFTIKTIEAAFIFPIIFAITAFFILFFFKTHDAVISKALQYGLLINQAVSCENSLYSPPKPRTKTEIADIINDLFLTSDRPSLLACLNGNSLYLLDKASSNPAYILFSNYERCNTIRKESAFISELLQNSK